MSLITFGFGGNITGLIALGLTGEVQVIIDAELQRLGKKPDAPTKAVLKRKLRIDDEFEEYLISAELKSINDEELVPSIKNAIIKKLSTSTRVHIDIKNISVNHRKNENNEIVIEVKCLTYRQPRKFRKIS
tara:strand:+ start:1275 stop:1667 length:393 start_codon:yes stop_codon:yes gene_type:complete